MTAPTPLDPRAPIGDGITGIEASAGTGKTFTIAAQVTRLIALEGIPLDEILVVTFTRAATAELKGRIRQRLVQTAEILEGVRPDPGDDEHFAMLLEADEDHRQRYVGNIKEALRNYDRAQIFTIHGFAIRLLSLLGFSSRIAPDVIPIDVDSDLIRQVIRDLAVARFADDAASFVPLTELNAIGQTVVTTPDGAIVPDRSIEDATAMTRVELAHEIRRQVSRRIVRSGYAGYDQLLLEARDALADPEVKEQARSALSRRYSVGLIDESQDTDPVQWDILNAVFADGRLVIIGDPKQSIYGFRGADIESYLASVSRATTTWTLNTNWRSDGPLLRGLDALLGDAAFGDDRIRYRKVGPAPGHEDARIEGPGAPLTIRRFDRDLPIQRYYNKPTERFNRKPASEVVAADVAAYVVDMLTNGTRLRSGAGWRAIEPGDIAVLCRTGRQVDAVRSELSVRGVPSVAARSGSVFHTEAAEEWLRLLYGMEQTERPKSVRFAASGLLMGVPVEDLGDLDDEDVVAIQSRLRSWREHAIEHGITSLLGRVARETELVSRVMGSSDGDRVMTDLMHLAEVMDRTWSTRHVGSLMAWLQTEIQESPEELTSVELEARERRLETDAQAVQVQTIHGAKGLEFPVVLCPYLWDGWTPKAPKVPIAHGPVGDDGYRRRFIDVGGPTGPDFVEHQTAALAAGRAEESRLLYVAVTRARHRLVVWWIDEARDTDKTVLNELLMRGIGDDDEPADLAWLTRASGGAVAVSTVDAMPPVVRYEPTDDDPPTLAVADFDRSIDYSWRRTSYTALSPEHPILPSNDTDEAPLRSDEHHVEDEEESVAPGVGTAVPPLADLPGGAGFGTLVHRILESTQLDASDLEHQLATNVETEVRRGQWELDESPADGRSSRRLAHTSRARRRRGQAVRTAIYSGVPRNGLRVPRPDGRPRHDVGHHCRHPGPASRERRPAASLRHQPAPGGIVSLPRVPDRCDRPHRCTARRRRRRELSGDGLQIQQASGAW